MPQYLSDGADKLNIIVRLVEIGGQTSSEGSETESGKRENGCGSSTAGVGTGVGMAILVAALAKKRK